MMPMLPLGNTGFTDVHTKLAAVNCLQQLGETATVIHVHLQRKDYLFFG